jgi:very-short-patch-repair endonuclease
MGGTLEIPVLKLEAALIRRPASTAFSGRTAAWLHGLDVAPCEPIETILAGEDDCDVVVQRGFRTTTLLRTIFDLTGRLSLVEAVVVADLALHAGLVRRPELTVWIDSRAGRKGVQQARRVLELAEAGSESPMESRLRMLLVLNGLPRPEVQVSLHDKAGSFLGRPDLYYREQRLGLEYDGETHRASLVEDNRRQNRLLMAGIRLLRFTAADVLRRPDRVLAQVRDLLLKR